MNVSRLRYSGQSEHRVALPTPGKTPSSNRQVAASNSIDTIKRPTVRPQQRPQSGEQSLRFVAHTACCRFIIKGRARADSINNETPRTSVRNAQAASAVRAAGGTLT